MGGARVILATVTRGGAMSSVLGGLGRIQLETRIAAMRWAPSYGR